MTDHKIISRAELELEDLRRELSSLGQTPHPTYSTRIKEQVIEQRMEQLRAEIKA